MREGVDYAWGYRAYGRLVPKALKAAGKTFVCRYVSTPDNSKNITAAEAKALRKAGLDVVIVFETTAGRALRGRAAGAYDAKQAHKQVVQAGGPINSVIYFAVDFDASLGEQTAIDNYFRGVYAALGIERIGAYGGYWVIKRLFDARLISYGWQTYAWSGGRWDPRAQLQQYKNGVRIGGVDCDLNRATVDNFGQWDYKPARRPAGDGDRPLPGPVPKPKWFWDALKEFLRRRGEKA